ncbi:MAG TPA: HDOD domain-containing protein [Gammaproteobacteria bacterium]
MNNASMTAMTEPTVDTLAARIAEDIAEAAREDRLELPGFPEAVLRIQRTMQTPDASADDVVRVLSAEPALAARALQIANSVQFRRTGAEVTDLRTAVSRLGFNLVRSIAVAHAIEQLRLRETYSASARRELESIWRSSIEVAAAAYVIAKHCARVNPDQALLAGLLHVLGRLYIVMRAEGIGGTPDAELASAAAQHQGEVGRLILASWGLPESLQRAVEHQDDLDYAGDPIEVTHVLIAAKHLTARREADAGTCGVIGRIAARGTHPASALEQHADELRELRRSLFA